MNFTNTSVESNVAPSFGFKVFPLDLLIVYNIQAALGVCFNLAHIAVAFNLPHERRHGGKHYRTFLISIASLDLSMALLRLVLSNQPAQILLGNHHALCIISAILNHGLLQTEVGLLFVAALDRLRAISAIDQYWGIFQVKHYGKVVLITLASMFSFYGGLAIAFHDVAYTVEVTGPCKMRSHKMPKLGLPSIGICAGLLGLSIMTYCCIFIKHYARHKNMSSKISLKDNYREVNRTLGVLLAGKVACWFPVIVACSLGPKCYQCTWAAMLTMGMNPVVNPFIYSMTTRRYRAFLRSMFGGSKVRPDSILDSTDSQATTGKKTNVSLETTKTNPKNFSDM